MMLKLEFKVPSGSKIHDALVHDFRRLIQGGNRRDSLIGNVILRRRGRYLSAVFEDDTDQVNVRCLQVVDRNGGLIAKLVQRDADQPSVVASNLFVSPSAPAEELPISLRDVVSNKANLPCSLAKEHKGGHPLGVEHCLLFSLLASDSFLLPVANIIQLQRSSSTFSTGEAPRCSDGQQAAGELCPSGQLVVRFHPVERLSAKAAEFHERRPPQSAANSPRLRATRHPAYLTTFTAEGVAQ